LDTNICIYRTLAYIEPRILRREDLEKVTEKIDTLTNNKLSCKIIITDTIYSELKDNDILFEEISDYCTNKLHYNRYKSLIIFEQAKKSINKFLIKYCLDQELKSFLKKKNLNLKEIDKFYLAFPDRLKKITQKKLNHLRPFQKNKKLSQRPKNLPEKNDRILLSEAIELNKNTDNDVYIFSNDSDFTEFWDEINKKFTINILKIDDGINIED